MTQQTRNDAAFTPQSKMAEVLEKRPHLRGTLMMEFHIGGCSHCGFDASDTVAQVAEDNGVPVDRLLAAINR